MKTLKILFPILLIALILSACEKELPFEEELQEELSNVIDNPELMGKKQQQRPFRARFISMPQGAAPNPAVCGSGLPVIALTQAGSGSATHMGNISLVLNSCVNVGVSPPVVLGATIVITAANGDELHLSGDGNQGSPFNIDGGTGRFTGAEGEVTGTFEVIERDPVTNTPTKISSTLDGYIIY